METNKTKNRRFRFSFGRAIVFILVVLVALQAALISHLFQENQLRDQRITLQEAKIKELQEKLQIINAIEDNQQGLNSNEVKQLGEVIYLESKRYVFDPMLIMALIITESSFRKNEISDFGAQGLMQIMPSTAAAVARREGISWISSADLYNPALNVKLGISYLFELIFKFKNTRDGMLAYNMGESTLVEYHHYKAEPPPHFYNKVISNYELLKNKYGDVPK
jgi:soluble lytic murein transglycosylase